MQEHVRRNSLFGRSQITQRPALIAHMAHDIIEKSRHEKIYIII